MKYSFLLLIAALYFTKLCAQQIPLSEKKKGPQTDPAKLLVQNRLENLPFLAKHPLALHARLLSGASILTPKKLSSFINEKGLFSTNGSPLAAATSAPLQNSSGKGKQGLLSCNNSSFFKIAGLTNSVVYVSNVAHTADDGVLITGVLYDSTVLHGDWKINAYLLKADNMGNILWAELLADQHPDNIYYLNPISVKEMPTGEIMMTSYID